MKRLSILVLFFLLVSCARQPVSPVPVATLTRTFTPSPSITPPPPTATGTPSPTMALTPTISPNDRASFVDETIVDYSILQPGERFVKTWRLKNTGSSAWTETYFLYRETSGQGEPLTDQARIPLDRPVQPGEVVEFSTEMTAPESIGTYTVYWSLRNSQGEIVPVDGGRFIWVTIRVCTAEQPCPPIPAGGSSASNGVSATLVSFTPQAQSAVAAFCMTLPGPNYGPSPTAVALILDGVSILASSGGSTSGGCFEFEFPVSQEKVQSAQSLVVSIAQVRILGGPPNPDAACQSAHATLTARYPGLDFTCQFSMAGYYTDLHLPPGMSREQADELIVDTIEGAINGPWLLTVR